MTTEAVPKAAANAVPTLQPLLTHGFAPLVLPALAVLWPPHRVERPGFRGLLIFPQTEGTGTGIGCLYGLTWGLTEPMWCVVYVTDDGVSMASPLQGDAEAAVIDLTAMAGAAFARKRLADLAAERA